MLPTPVPSASGSPEREAPAWSQHRAAALSRRAAARSSVTPLVATAHAAVLVEAGWWSLGRAACFGWLSEPPSGSGFYLQSLILVALSVLLVRVYGTLVAIFLDLFILRTSRVLLAPRRKVARVVARLLRALGSALALLVRALGRSSRPTRARDGRPRTRLFSRDDRTAPSTILRAEPRFPRAA